MNAAMFQFATLALLILAAHHGSGLFLPDSPDLRELLSRYQDDADRNFAGEAASSRTRRAIQFSDREEILQLHNKLRGAVYPPASNMEFMLWDDELEQSATQWAHQCQWEHGPQHLLMSIGQNLAVHVGRPRSSTYHVQAWYDEVKDYTYPYPQECNPSCPDRCSGPMCTHYTQLVWATTNRIGCAVHVCPRMDVWGDVWQNAVYLVCNYSPKGNWIGEAPYQYGSPCSKCPPSYGGRCRDNLCYKGESRRPETEDMNEVEKPQVPVRPPATTTAKPAPKPKPVAPKRPSTANKQPATRRPQPSRPTITNFLVQNIKCETRMRDKCRGPTCNRYNCPADCMNKKGKVWGTLFYDVQSSICRAAMHYGAIDNRGGLVDITRKDSLPFFIKSTKNGIESFSKFKRGNAFTLSRVQEVSVDCFTSVGEVCPFSKLIANCPRVLCPADCKRQPSYWAPVVGSTYYADSSSICRAAIHAGVIRDDGGYVDILPLEKRKSYVATLKNGIQSESLSDLEGGSFRVFTVRQ